MRASTALGLSLAGTIMVSAAAVRADSAFLLQLGSFPTEEAANEKWNSLKEGHAKVLGELSNRVAKVPVGDGKIIYRLQAGPIADRKDANAACAALKEDKLDCYLVETATLSEAAPKQALSAVRQSDGDELQLGKQGEESGIIKLDEAMPRMTQMNPPPAAASPKISFEDHAAPAASPAFSQAESGSHAAEEDAPKSEPEPAAPEAAPKTEVPALAPAPQPSPTEASAEPKAEDWKSLPKPQPMSRLHQPHYKLHDETSAKLVAAPAASALDESHTYVAPADAPTMGRLGTLKLRQDGEVLGASAPLAKAVPPSSETPRLARQLAGSPMPSSPNAPSDMQPDAPVSIPLLAPPPSHLNRPVMTAEIPTVTPEQTERMAMAQQSDGLGGNATSGAISGGAGRGMLTNSTDPNARVEVREAIPVAGNALAPNLVPVAPEAASAPTPAYAPPAAWRGTPSSAAMADTHWAQFGHFINETTAFAFMDNLSASAPALTRGVRVRALRPLLNRGLGRHVALRVGPYRTQEEVDTFCAAVAQARQPCNVAQETGLPAAEDMPSGTFRTGAELQQAQQASLPSGQGAVFVQLGSYGSEAEAYNRFSALLSSRAKMLGGMRPTVTKPRNNSGAPVYRLRVGPFMDQRSALDFCNQLANSGTGCVLVKE